MSSQVPFPDPQEPSTGSSSTTDPMPVLGYANPARTLSDGQRVLAWIGIMAGSVMTLVGIMGVAIGCCLAYVGFFQPGETEGYKEVGSIILFVGLFFLVPGYWISRICFRRLRRNRGS